MMIWSGGQLQTHFSFQQPLTFTLVYPDQPRHDESSHQWLVWTGTSWEDAACGSYQRDTAGNRLVVPVCTTGGSVWLSSRV